jgi:hypothetical protein
MDSVLSAMESELRTLDARKQAIDLQINRVREAKKVILGTHGNKTQVSMRSKGEIRNRVEEALRKHKRLTTPELVKETAMDIHAVRHGINQLRVSKDGNPPKVIDGGRAGTNHKSPKVWIYAGTEEATSEEEVVMPQPEPTQHPAPSSIFEQVA